MNVGQINRAKTHCVAGHPLGPRPITGPRYCRTCAKQRYQKWYDAHLEEEQARQRGKMAVRSTARKTAASARYRHKCRQLALDHYGRSCACCGETEEVFLTFDHANNDGHTHRKTDRKYLPRFLKVLGFPDGYQVLCWNCNAAKSIRGVCPHKSHTEVRICRDR